MGRDGLRSPDDARMMARVVASAASSCPITLACRPGEGGSGCGRGGPRRQEHWHAQRQPPPPPPATHLERVGQGEQAVAVVLSHALHGHPCPGGHHLLNVACLHHRHHGRQLRRAAQPRLEFQLAAAQQGRLLKQQVLRGVGRRLGWGGAGGAGWGSARVELGIHGGSTAQHSPVCMLHPTPPRTCIPHPLPPTCTASPLVASTCSSSRYEVAAASRPSRPPAALRAV